MAILKAAILAIALSFSLPLGSGLLQPQPYIPVRNIDASGSVSSVVGQSPGSVIYKSETGFPDFMTKKSLPARSYPPAPMPYPAASNQTIAAL